MVKRWMDDLEPIKIIMKTDVQIILHHPCLTLSNTARRAYTVVHQVTDQGLLAQNIYPSVSVNSVPGAVLALFWEMPISY